MRFVFDSNIFCADYLMKGNAFRIFLSSVPRLSARLLVPQVVLDEVKNKYSVTLSEFSTRIERSLREWNRMTENTRQIGILTITDEVGWYQRYMKEKLNAIGAVIVPYPNSPHEIVSRRAIEKRKPFDDRGSGYRDALIWLTILDLIKAESTNLTLVTANRRDFCEGTALHPDLIKDLDALGVDSAVISLFVSLEEANQRLILPHLQRLDELIDLIGKEAFDPFSLQGWAEMDLKDLLRDGDYGHDLVGLEPHHGSARVNTRGFSLNTVTVDDVRRLASGDVLVSARASINAEVGVSADGEDYERHKDVREIFGNEPIGSGWADADIPTKADVEFTLILENTSFKVLSAEIDVIDGECGRIDYNPHPKRSG